MIAPVIFVPYSINSHFCFEVSSVKLSRGAGAGDILETVHAPCEMGSRSPTLANVRPPTENLISRRQWANWRRACTADIEHRKAFTLPKDITLFPVRRKANRRPLDRQGR